jgi:ABC-2 type transport system permease protein
MEFRAQFFAGMVGYAIWTCISLVFIEVVFGQIGAVRGWTRDQMWVLYGTYVILESLCYGLLGPNMWRFPDTIRTGGLDLVLTKPVDAQFFVSTRYLDLNAVLNSAMGLALITIGLSRIGDWPTPFEWLSWLLLTMCGFIMAYSIWFASVTIAIWAVKLEGIAVIFDPMMQLARFPIDIYPKRALTFLTIGLPVAFLTTYPAQALLGRGNASQVFGGLALALVFCVLSACFFRFALRFYGSASS